MQALSVVIYPRIWLLEHQCSVNLDDKLLDRVEIVFDEPVNKLVDDSKRASVNVTWRALDLFYTENFCLLLTVVLNVLVESRLYEAATPRLKDY